MILSIFLLFIFIILVFFYAGFKYRPDFGQKSQIFHIVSFSLTLILGAVILAQGIEVRDGSVETISGNTTTINYSYEVMKGGFDSYGLSYIFFFVGLMLAIATFFYIDYEGKKEYSEESE